VAYISKISGLRIQIRFALAKVCALWVFSCEGQG